MSVFRNIVDRVNLCYTSLLVWGGGVMYRREVKKLLRLHPGKKASGEQAWTGKWRKLKRCPDVGAYRLFSQYIGYDQDIVPEGISSGIVQPILNPAEYRPYYQDKNMFDKILPPEFNPITIMRKINRGGYYTAVYQHFTPSDESIEAYCSGIDRVFLKPATDSSSGHGVVAFRRNESGVLATSDGQLLNLDFLEQYSKSHPDFILQKGLTQSEYISQFNPTSINTLRIATYRSVKDNRTHVCAAIMRIGQRGAAVDNAHAGGLFVGVGLDGTIGKYACDQYGNRYDTFNNINFKENHYRIPDFDRVIRFAEAVGDHVVHHRLLAQDICIEADGTPRLVEFNIRAFSVWLFQFTSGPAFGKYADEIIEYCSHHLGDVNKVFVEPF